MLLSEFKNINNIASIDFYQSDSLVGYADLPDGSEATFITTKDFDPSEPALVLKNTRADEETSETANVYWVINSAPKEEAFSL